MRETQFVAIREMISETNPAFGKWILQDMGLSRSPSFLKHVQDYLDFPQPLSTFYNARKRLLQMHGLTSLACLLQDNVPAWHSEPSMKHVLGYEVNLAVILEILTQALLTDLVALHRIISIMTTSQYNRFRNKLTNGNYTGETRGFVDVKCRGMAFGVKRIAGRLTRNDNSVESEPFLQINILEAVHIDNSSGFALAR